MPSRPRTTPEGERSLVPTVVSTSWQRPHRGVRQSFAEWRLAWRALRIVVWVRVALWRWPYARVLTRLELRRTKARPASALVSRGRDLARDPDALAWAVRAAARRVPKASCLTQALTLEALLAQAGHHGEIKIGVGRDEDGGFEAHAWLEHDGRILVGARPDLERFSVLAGGTKPPGQL